MSTIFQVIFYQPIFNLLVFIYNVVPGHEIAFVILILTVLIKLILYPLSKKALESQIKLSDLQPEINKLKEKYKDKKPELSKALMDLYKDKKINPFSSCLPLLIQLPFLIAVYKVFINGLKSQNFDLIYSFISKPEFINPMSFGLVDFSKPNIILAVLAGLSQFLQSKFMPKTPNLNTSNNDKEADFSQIMNKQMIYVFPVLTIVICVSLPSGLAFYWILLSLLSVLQQIHLMKKYSKKTSSSENSEDKVIEGEILKK